MTGSFVFGLILVAIVSSASLEDDQREWDAFRTQYKKLYMSQTEEKSRFEIFRHNLRSAEELSLTSPQATWGWTAFSDLTPEEFSKSHGLLSTHKIASRDLPLFSQPPKTSDQSTDWRARGLVSSIKNQAHCGSCWAFATAAGAEGCYASHFNKTIDLSPQHVMDCSGDGIGCNGGLPNFALHWTTKHDVATWSSYPYMEKKGSCRSEGSFVVGLKAGTCNYYKVAAHEKAIREALTHATVPILLAAAPLQSYRGGIINGSACSHKLVDHAVLVVADTNGVYTVKNSWGPSWGESGFFRMAQDVNCLLMTTDASVAY